MIKLSSSVLLPCEARMNLARVKRAFWSIVAEKTSVMIAIFRLGLEAIRFLRGMYYPRCLIWRTAIKMIRTNISKRLMNSPMNTLKDYWEALLEMRDEETRFRIDATLAAIDWHQDHLNHRLSDQEDYHNCETKLSLVSDSVCLKEVELGREHYFHATQVKAKISLV